MKLQIPAQHSTIIARAKVQSTCANWQTWQAGLRLALGLASLKPPEQALNQENDTS